MAPAHPPLLGCPADILLPILEDLTAKDLHAVCLVCRDLHALAQLVLYSSIHWTWTGDGYPPVHLLLRTILLRPDLANHTRSLVLAGARSDRKGSRLLPMKMSVPKASLAGPIEFGKGINVPHGDDWIRALQNGELGAFVAVLLAQLPNLESLEMVPDFSGDALFLGLVFRSALASRKLPAFPHSAGFG